MPRPKPTLRDRLRSLVDRVLGPAPLYSSDGQFMCSQNHAVEVAYMVSCAECAFMTSFNFGDEREYQERVQEHLESYMSGETTTQEAVALICQEATEYEAEQARKAAGEEEEGSLEPVRDL